MITMMDLLAGHPFLSGLRQEWLERLSAQSKRIVYHQGQRIIEENQHADRFLLIRHGAVGLDLHVPGRGNILIEKLGPETVLGWSWLYPPYKWHFGAVAAEQTLAISCDAAGVRRLFDQDPAFGYDMAKRFLGVMADRLAASRHRLVDLYSPTAPMGE